jgi:hypothetical protein
MITNDLEELSAMIKFNLNLRVAMVPGTIDFLRIKTQPKLETARTSKMHA